jgi:hypothetical protein
LQNLKTARGSWRKILLGLVSGLLIACSTPFVVALAVYVASPQPEEPDPTFVGILAAITIGPSIMLGLAARGASRVSLQWDLGQTGGRVLMFASYLLAAILGICGLYAVVRLVKLLAAD